MRVGWSISPRRWEWRAGQPDPAWQHRLPSSSRSWPSPGLSASSATWIRLPTSPPASDHERPASGNGRSWLSHPRATLRLMVDGERHRIVDTSKGIWIHGTSRRPCPWSHHLMDRTTTANSTARCSDVPTARALLKATTPNCAGRMSWSCPSFCCEDEHRDVRAGVSRVRHRRLHRPARVRALGLDQERGWFVTNL